MLHLQHPDMQNHTGGVVMVGKGLYIHHPLYKRLTQIAQQRQR